MTGGGRPPGHGPGPTPRRGRGRSGAGRPGAEGHDTARSLGGALDEYLASRGLSDIRTLADVVGCWEEVVGAEVAAHARPRSVAGGELVVAVDHPGWVTQLAFLSATICDRLADQLGYRPAERLRGHVDTRFRLD